MTDVPSSDDPTERSERWDVEGPGVLAFRLEQGRQRYRELRDDLRAARQRAAVLVAAAVVAAPIALLQGMTVLRYGFGGIERLDLFGVVVAVALTAILVLLWALIELATALPGPLAPNPYRMDELGHPERYLTPRDRVDFASSIDVLRYRQIQRLRTAVRDLEEAVTAQNGRLRRGVALLIVALLLLLTPAMVSTLLPRLLPS